MCGKRARCCVGGGGRVGLDKKTMVEVVGDGGFGYGAEGVGEGLSLGVWDWSVWAIFPLSSLACRLFSHKSNCERSAQRLAAINSSLLGFFSPADPVQAPVALVVLCSSGFYVYSGKQLLVPPGSGNGMELGECSIVGLSRNKLPRREGSLTLR